VGWFYLLMIDGSAVVGFFRPLGGIPSKWIPVSVHKRPEDAARRVHWLNGGDALGLGPDGGRLPTAEEMP
jgi:hypothetical protein